MLRYEGDVFRPPNEAGSLIVQATIGCSHNRCTFCAMYKRKRYRERSIEEVKADIETASARIPRVRRVFLADGNALSIAFDKLHSIMELFNRSFPELERISLYANPHDLLGKTVEELQELKGSGLGMIYLGLES